MPNFGSTIGGRRASGWEVAWSAFGATVRSLLRARWFTLGAVLTISVAIGLNIAVLSVVDRMLFRPLPYRDADRLVHLHRATVRTPVPRALIDQVTLLALRERASTFEELASASGLGRSEVIDGLGQAPLLLASASPNLLRVLRLRPALGRDFVDGDLNGQELALLLSYDVWRTRLGSAPDVAGRRFAGYRVVGVLPPEFSLAAIGLFAVASFEASRRRHEMGVRLTLGATRRQIQRLIITGALRPVAIGSVIGLGVCWWAATFLQGYLFEVDARDPATYALVASLLLVTAAIASWWPARVAGSVDPSTSLRAN